MNQNINSNANILKQKLEEYGLISNPIYNLSSRCQLLNESFIKKESIRVYLKRDDELGGVIPNGTKMRKFASLIPMIIKKKPNEVAVIGGMNSNNVVGLCSLLIQHQIKPHVFLCSHHHQHQQQDPSNQNPIWHYKDSSNPLPIETNNNFFFLNLLLPKSQISFVSHLYWNQVEELIQNFYLKNGQKMKSKFVELILILILILFSEKIRKTRRYNYYSRRIKSSRINSRIINTFT